MALVTQGVPRMGDGHLYERAAKRITGTPGEVLPIWHLGRDRALFIGPLGHNAPHAHSVPVYLAGVYEPFRLRIGAGAWTHVRASVIPAGLSYEFDIAGQPLAVLYLEPSAAGADALSPLVAEGGALSILRELYEARDGAVWTTEALDSLLAFSRQRARRSIDARISRVVTSLARSGGQTISAADAARDVGLSSSRFQHLFAEEVGVPFRRFRVWQRLRAAIAEIVAGSSFTDAAHAAGFADQAHFSRAFRQAFGAPASPSLRKVRPRSMTC
jgi:AraC-like DNA-binding protein